MSSRSRGRGAAKKGPGKRLPRVFPVLCAAALVGILACVSFAWDNSSDRGSLSTSGDFPAGAEIPRCSPPLSTNPRRSDHEVHHYTGFSLCYRESYELAEWAAYVMTREKLTAVTSRTDNFTADPHITTASPRADDYRHSGFDRGHLAPAADMRWSEKAMAESFYMSNMTPQTPSLNRGVWQRLEQAVRDAAASYGTVLVACGPILDSAPEAFDSIGISTKITVPRYFYKVLAAYVPGAPGAGKHLETIGFVIENASPKGDYHAFAFSVDEVEKRTGIDFFAALEDAEEDRAEAVFDAGKW